MKSFSFCHKNRVAGQYSGVCDSQTDPIIWKNVEKLLKKWC